MLLYFLGTHLKELFKLCLLYYFRYYIVLLLICYQYTGFEFYCIFFKFLLNFLVNTFCILYD